MSDGDGRQRGAIRPGVRVAIVQKQDQRTGRTVEGVVAAVLTRSTTHPHGIKVRLVDGRVGRVKAVLGDDPSSTA
ncbi:MAG: YwbE family protein [Methanospirillum sp.]